MALAFNGYPRVDVESLLFDLKDILRTSLQVNKAQSAEIVRLGGKLPTADFMVAEYEERVHVALGQVDTVLDLFESESFEAASTDYEFDIAAWIQNTNTSLGLTFESSESVTAPAEAGQEAVNPNLDVDSAASVALDVPVDFWNVHDFKWEDEPLSDTSSENNQDFGIDIPSNTNQRPITTTIITSFDREEKQTPDREDDDVYSKNGLLVPEEDIPVMWLDSDEYSDHSSNTPRASNFDDDSATLYYPDDSSPTSTYLSHRRRHTLVGSGGKLSQRQSHHAFHHKHASIALVGNEKLHTIFTPSPRPAPTRPFGLYRTSSAPDLRALRTTHDLFLREDDEPMLVSAY